MEQPKNNLLEDRLILDRPIQTLYHLIDIRWWRYLWILLCFFVKHSPSFAVPYLVKVAIDSLAEPDSISQTELVVTFMVLVVLILQNIPSHLFYIRMISKELRNMELRLREALSQRLHQLSMNVHNDRETGRIHAKVMRDVEQVHQMCHFLFESVPNGIFAFSVTVVYTAFSCPPMLLFYLIMAPVCVGIRRAFKRSIRTRNEEYRARIEDMGGNLSNMIQMIPVARAHGVEDRAIQDMNHHYREVHARGRHLDGINALFSASSWVVMNLSFVLGIVVSFTLCRMGYITIGEVVLFQSLFQLIMGSLQTFLSIYPHVSRGFASVHSLAEILECPDLEVNEGKRGVDEVEGRIQIQNLSFRYRDDQPLALDGVNLLVEPGECVAIVGPSGSGKSTMMNLVMGFQRSNAGRVLLDDRDVNDIDMRQWRRYLSVVPQQPLLYSGTLRENILYGLEDVNEDDLEEVLEAANVKEFVDRWPAGLETRVGEGGAQLSGGQRQRISIARALIRDPRVIILDEATSALDVVSEKSVQEALDRLIIGRTTFIIAHRLSTIRNAHQIVVLDEGRIAEEGKATDLMALRGHFYKLQQLNQA